MTEINADTIVWHGSDRLSADPYTWHDVSDLIDRTQRQSAQMGYVRPASKWEGATVCGTAGWTVPSGQLALHPIFLDGGSDAQLWLFGDSTVEHMDLRREPSFLDRLKRWIGL